MVFVLADDFSGAAEMGGIGHRYGLRAEIQLQLDIRSRADLIVLDTDTRSLTEDEATKKIFDTATALKKWNGPFHLFKKIDSVMRGHLVPELNALQQSFNFNRILLMPANPGRGRKIIGGEYFMNGKRLSETVFATDPDFPVVFADIGKRIGSYRSALKHVHITTSDPLPSSSIVTGDVDSKIDLKKYVASMQEDDLCSGAAELFESYLEHLGYLPGSSDPLGVTTDHAAFTLVINGSTVKNQSERDWYDRQNIKQFPVPTDFKGIEFERPEDADVKWFQKVLSCLYSNKVAVITIDHPVQHSKTLSEKFLKYFVALMEYITRDIEMTRIHVCLTGGATASSVIRHFVDDKLLVKGEIIPGVVSLVMESNGVQRGLFTVKPGSYPWPPKLIESFSG